MTQAATIRMEEVPWEECFLPTGRNPQLEREMRQRYGVVPPHIPYFAPCPWVPRAHEALASPADRPAHLDPDLVQRIGLVVSQDNSCRYCFASVRLFMRLRGVPEDRIRRLEQDVLVDDYPEHERTVLALARRLSRADPLPGPEAFAALRDHGYSEEAIKEFACVVGGVCFANRISTFAAVPPHTTEQLPDRWYMRLLRPLLARRLRRGRSEDDRDRREPGLPEGDFGYVAAGLEGLPIGRGVRQAIEMAWSSPHLSRRARALVIAVIGLGLGCELSVREATRILGEEGLAPDEVERILRDLASPRLTPVEAVVVPFARETIWYRPAQVQRRAREVHAKLTGPQFLDLVGTSALGNLLCRLGPVLRLP
ncbi:MAG: hypothetical protein R3263_06150 [Myxococcota bacterium]|nr:hypothetical protein [Myxococcota bacterium]